MEYGTFLCDISPPGNSIYRFVRKHGEDLAKGKDANILHTKVGAWVVDMQNI